MIGIAFFFGAKSVSYFVCCDIFQHFDKRRQYEKAHSYINLAIEHTPTVIDLYLVKVPILETLM